MVLSGWLTDESPKMCMCATTSVCVSRYFWRVTCQQQTASVNPVCSCHVEKVQIPTNTERAHANQPLFVVTSDVSVEDNGAENVQRVDEDKEHLTCMWWVWNCCKSLHLLFIALWVLSVKSLFVSYVLQRKGSKIQTYWYCVYVIYMYQTQLNKSKWSKIVVFIICIFFLLMVYVLVLP